MQFSIIRCLLPCWLCLSLISHCTTGFTLLPMSTRILRSSTGSCNVITTSSSSSSRMILSSSFFGDFEKFDMEDDDEEEDEDDDDEEEEDDDDEYADVDDKSVEDFRSRMGNLFGGDDSSSSSSSSSSIVPPPTASDVSSVDELIDFARKSGGKKGSLDSSSSETEDKEWAKPTDDIQSGVILIANPEKFCTDFGKEGKKQRPSPALLAKFGLTLPPPKDLGPDRRADLLPVLALVERDDNRPPRAVLLNRRTGYLLGDLEQPSEKTSSSSSKDNDDNNDNDDKVAAPLLEKFCIQPLWFGGIDNLSSGLDMLHLCPAVIDAVQITDDGLYWGGDPSQAQEAMEDPSLDKVMTGFDFKFFVQSTLWSPKDLDQEIEDGIWFVANVSKDVLFKSRDRMGTRRAKPLWTEIMELMGGKYLELRNTFYADE